MKKPVKIGKASELLGVSIQTLHNWERTGELIPHHKSNSGTRYYDPDKLCKKNPIDMVIELSAQIKEGQVAVAEKLQKLSEAVEELTCTK